MAKRILKRKRPVSVPNPHPAPIARHDPRYTTHFNGLSEAETERLNILIEECSEVIKEACKILRHGHRHYNGSLTNRERLEREIGDVSHAMRRMIMAGDIDGMAIELRARSKPERIKPYLHHQEE